MVCQICYKPNRKVRFQSPRISICQWCISELCAADISPNQILANLQLKFEHRRRVAIEKEIKSYVRQKSAPPTIDPYRLSQIHTAAEREVRNYEGIWTGLYRSLIDDSARNERIQQIVNPLIAQLNADHQIQLEQHAIRQRELTSEISFLQIELSRAHDDAEQDVQEYLASIPTKSKEDRLLRAHILGLINSDHVQLDRPEESEYETLKRTIRKEDAYRCICCSREGTIYELHVHHIIPLFKFGSNNKCNLVTLCHKCHNKQHPDFQVTRNQPIHRASRKKRFIAVNIKTTGFSNEDSIIEIGASLFIDDKLHDIFQSLVYTKRQIPSSVTRLTGITQDAIQRAPRADVVFFDFLKFISDSRLVFHNASFDMRFLTRYADYFNKPINNSIYDTVAIARKKLPNLTNHKLSTLIEHLQIQVNQKHRAKEDSIAAGMLYIQLSGLKKARASRKAKQA